nr:uncharacterized protein LOC107456741 [Parasteatoda tepidariorum]
MPSDQVEQIRQALNGNGGGGVQTYQVPGGQGGGQPTDQQTFQFSSFSQIPQSLLDQLSSAQISNIRRELTPTYHTIPQQPQQIPQGNTQTLQFSKFSEIPRK